MSKKNKDKKISTSIFRKRWKKFKTLKRGYYSFVIVLFLYAISFILPLLIGRDALIVKYNGNYYFPVFKYYSAESLGQNLQGEANYRLLKKQYMDEGKDNWVLMPLYPYGPNENLLSEMEGNPPHYPSGEHWCGTDDRGRDVFSRLAYGFNIGLSFSIIVTLLTLIIGIAIGAALGFYSGKVDIIGQRLI